MAKATQEPTNPVDPVEAYLNLDDDVLDGLSDGDFLAQQRLLLETERVHYTEQAAQLRAEADSMVQNNEPAEVQFDEESGEGGTTAIDRERDLALAGSALAAIEEVDLALRKMDRGVYGLCESCKQSIPRARLRALPFARLCVRCKEGGLPRSR
ncbi:TraR/DksA family transcriptional regulator [Ferrimicrobium acidiphilum]|jgi:DnaK suppressor protein|uniref:General stress protein 16O n=1 Tax=Ferrimicrobium acidiphilum DSM 19497 TaxID=1121877 RepID=A0A0D8FU18_9ACTN|nr:TraR/DksA family transcriptional regulator [Ferrimicrobium acidiphilum]KJE76631.1 general stress protein 16O [Ferrimicrobium acidiphilum DSM 19497]MCL5052759.1 TraR/DksA family transcriptional regulator [Gammaproteobacteria bacterium]